MGKRVKSKSTVYQPKAAKVDYSRELTQPLEDNMVSGISDYVYYLYQHPYEILRIKELYDRIGGHVMTWGQRMTVPKGVVIMTKYFELPDDREKYLRVYIGHGTSNKLQRDFFGWIGKTVADYYWIPGPKWLWYLRRKGHRLRGKVVKTGNLTSDSYVTGYYSREEGLKRLGLSGEKPVALVSFTYGGMTLNRMGKHVFDLVDEYDVVLGHHPLDRWSPAIEKEAAKTTLYEGDIHRVLYAADLLISDESSVIYDFLATGKPILLVKPPKSGTYWDPKKYDIRYHVPVYIPEIHNLKAAVAAAKAPEVLERLERLRDNVFYFNDGKGIDRAEAWIRRMVKPYMDQQKMRGVMGKWRA